MKIDICLDTQTLHFFEQTQHNIPTNSYRISSAKNGPGSKKNSLCTPIGRHIIRAKIGNNIPIGGVFVGRRFTGEIYNPTLAQAFPDRDWILSRILWLSGLDIGQNRLGEYDSMQRYIYIHGTPDTEPMGTPLSHGCIRMKNTDIIHLFDKVKPYTPVNITSKSK